MTRTLLIAAVALLSIGVAEARGYLVGFGDTAALVSIESGAPNMRSHLLTAGNILSNADYSQAPISFASPGGVQHLTGWTTYDADRLGVPATAKAVILGLKLVITKGDNPGDAVLYVHARAHGSACCPGGDPAHPEYPIDGNYGNPVQAMIGQAAANLPHDSVRQVSSVIVPLAGGALDLSWGFRRLDGTYPASDGIGVAVYVNGYLA